MLTNEAKVKINNMPNDHGKYVIARVVDGELWYWGSWDDKSKAEACKKEFENGVMGEM